MGHRVFPRTVSALASAALGLVAALAWNEAIREAIRPVLGERGGLVGLYVDAVAATVLAVAGPVALARAAARVGGEAAIVREAEG